MKKSLLTVGAALLCVCLMAPAARAQDQPPAPPVTPPVVPPVQPPVQPPPAAVPAPPQVVTPPPAPVPLGVRTVMVFPFENAAMPEVPPPFSLRELGEQVSEAVREGLERSRAYSTVKFSPDSVLVQRARDESPPMAGLAQAIAEVVNPTTGAVDQARAMQIAARTGMQSLMLGSIEEYRHDPATHRVEIIGSATLLNATTGEPIRNAAVSGSATGTPGQSEIALAQVAANDLAQRLLASLSIPPPPQITVRPTRRERREPPTQAEEGSRNRIPGWIPALLLGGLVVATVK